MGIDIIGSQDGPAAVLVSGNPGLSIVLLLLTAALITGAAWLFRHKRKK